MECEEFEGRFVKLVLYAYHTQLCRIAVPACMPYRIHIVVLNIG